MPASKLAQVLSRGAYKSRKQQDRVILVVSRESNFKCRIAPRSLDIEYSIWVTNQRGFYRQRINAWIKRISSFGHD